MRDMSRPGPRLPAAPDHERHDPLLVAQLVAGDPLKPEQQAEAQRLVAACGACAALAADLPAVSALVAREPVPPRRRDFHLDPETAHALRGNVITRFLRGLSLPSSRAFQPAAAGVLSIGLLFVVAGYAWPGPGTVTVQAEPNFIDWSPSAAATLLDEAVPAPAFAEELEVADGDALIGADRAMEDDDFADSLAESQAGIAVEPSQKSQRQSDDAAVADDESSGPARESARMETYSDVSESEIAELRSAAEPVAEPDGNDTGLAFEQQAADVVAGAVEAPTEVSGGAAAGAEIVVLADEDGPEELLIAVGLALAIGGGGLLLLGWLSRRARDPLAP